MGPLFFAYFWCTPKIIFYHVINMKKIQKKGMWPKKSSLINIFWNIYNCIPVYILNVSLFLFWKKKIKITYDVNNYLFFFFFQIVKMLVIVVAVFGVCWLPLHVFAMLVDFYEGFLQFENEQEHLRVLIMFLCVHWLAMSNSFANPIIYGFTNENFRVSFP